MEIGTAIKTIRKKKGLTQKQMGDKCNLSLNAVSNIEKNASFPPKATIERICKVLEIPVSYLLFLSISDEDIPEETKVLFHTLGEPLKEALLKDVKPGVTGE